MHDLSMAMFPSVWAHHHPGTIQSFDLKYGVPSGVSMCFRGSAVRALSGTIVIVRKNPVGSTADILLRGPYVQTKRALKIHVCLMFERYVGRFKHEASFYIVGSCRCVL